MGYLLDTGLLYKETVFIRETEFLDLANTPIDVLDSALNLGYIPVILAANIYLDGSSVGYNSFQHIWLTDAGAAIKAVIDEAAVTALTVGRLISFSVNAWNPPSTRLGTVYDTTRSIKISAGQNPVGDGNAYLTLIYYKMPLI